MRHHAFIANLMGAAMALAFAVTAQALNNRSFVAMTGDDANNCSAGAYCRTFTAALAVTNPGGEIVVVDSGGYGAATISQPVVITAIGIDASITATSGNALTINTTGDVTITGLNLHGEGTGSSGVEVFAVGFLRLYNMQIENFASFGIDFSVNGNLAVYDSKITDSGLDGLAANNASAKVYVQNTAFDHNAGFGALANGGATLTIVDSSAHYNTIAFEATNSSMALYGDRVMLNTFGIVAAGGTGQLYFADCLVSDNTTSYAVGDGGTMTGSNPGTTLITPGQATNGTLSTATVLQ
jgi:hypothetical protein